MTTTYRGYRGGGLSTRRMELVVDERSPSVPVWIGEGPTERPLTRGTWLTREQVEHLARALLFALGKDRGRVDDLLPRKVVTETRPEFRMVRVPREIRMEDVGGPGRVVLLRNRGGKILGWIISAFRGGVADFTREERDQVAEGNPPRHCNGFFDFSPCSGKVREYGLGNDPAYLRAVADLMENPTEEVNRMVEVSVTREVTPDGVIEGAL